ncbi:MAG: hypothetical protein P9M14_02285 [Candidatus Alcyoniella australis]|nr:hypothetical protein [Candidatus Alcyoniella australis]
MSRTQHGAAAIAAACALLLFATRLAVPTLGGQPSLAEELVTGSIANALLEGPELPLWGYHAAEHGLGSLALAFAALPWFLLLGKTAISLKAGALTLGAISAALIVLLAGRLEGLGGAALAAVFCVLMPPGAFLAAAYARGPALPCLAAGLGALYAALRTLEDPHGRVRWPLLWGLLSGLAVSVDNAMLAPVLVPLGLAIIRDADFLLRRRALLLLSGTAVGTLPLLLLKQPPLSSGFFGPEALVIRVAAQPDILWLAASLPALLGLLAVYERTRKQQPYRRAQAACMVLWIVVLGVVVAARDSRLLDALAMVLALPVAALCRRLLRSSLVLGVLAVTALLLPGLFGQLDLLRSPATLDRPELLGPGYDRVSHLVEAGMSWSNDSTQARELVSALNPRSAAAFAFGFGEAHGAGTDPLEQKLMTCADLPEPVRAACAVGVGYACHQNDQPLDLPLSRSRLYELVQLGMLVSAAREGYFSTEQIAEYADLLCKTLDPRIGPGIRNLVHSLLAMPRDEPVK